MTPKQARSAPSGEGGFVLIEVLVSALVLALVAAGAFTLFQASARSAGQERNRSRAFAVAQEDQARMRAMRLANLNGLKQVSHPAIDGTKFEVESTGVFINNTTSTASCTGEGASNDYVRIVSKVTWPKMEGRPPVVLRSIFAPSTNNSLDPEHGTLTIYTMNAANGPLAGVGISLTGPGGTFTGTTDETGCANFPDIQWGNYTMTPSAPSLVGENGKPPASKTVGVIASGTQTVELRYDLPGSLAVQFSTRVGSTSVFKASSANSIMAFNTGMETPKAFATSGGLPASAVEASGLFPFTSPYAVYAGSCAGNNPNPKSEKEAPGAAALASIVVPPGEAAPLPLPTIQLPALNLTVKTGSTTITGAKVRITGKTCSFERNYTTAEGGVLSDPGLPWGSYEVCASAKVGTTQRWVKKSPISVQNLTSGTTLNLDVSGSGSESGSSKVCW